MAEEECATCAYQYGISFCLENISISHMCSNGYAYVFVCMYMLRTAIEKHICVHWYMKAACSMRSHVAAEAAAHAVNGD